MEKYIIFDIDGTINKTENYVFKAYKECFEKYGINITKNEIIKFIGCTPKQIQDMYFSNKNEEFLKKWYEDIEKYEKEYMDKYAEPFYGVIDSLEKLKNEGYKLVVCSNADDNHITNVLNAIKLTKYFDYKCSIINGYEKKDILKIFLDSKKPCNACMIGDRKFDKEAAKYNKIPFIGCNYGYAPNEIKDADIVIQNASEIYDAVKSII